MDGTTNIGELRRLSESDISAILNELKSLSYENVNQPKIGDCCFLAALMAMMNSKQGREFLRNGIEPHYGPDGKIDGFLVTMYSDPAHPDESGPTTTLVRSVYSNGVSSDARGASVVSLFEAAYAQGRSSGTNSSGILSDGISGGWGHEAMTHLTGIPSTTVSSTGFLGFGIGFSTDERQRVINAVADGLPATASSNPRIAPWTDHYMSVPAQIGTKIWQIKVVRNHEYMVVKADEDRVTLANLWGMNPGLSDQVHDQAFTLTWEEFEDHFREVSMGGGFP